MTHTMYCKNCDEKFERTHIRKFCSVKCSAEFNGKNKLVGGDTSSLDAFIKKYGVEIGTIKYQEKSEKLSKKRIGKTSAMKGKTHSEKTKRKISEAIKNSDAHKSYIQDIRENGFPETQKAHLRKCMKGVFSLDWFVEKYGEIEGQKEYQERCNNISKTSYFKIFNN